MKNLIISTCIIGLFLELSGAFWTMKRDPPSEAFLRLTTPPARSIHHPLENGYFVLLGLTASTGRDPVQTGYDIWLESEAHLTRAGFDFNKPGRLDLTLPASVDRLIPAWNAADPLAAFHEDTPNTGASKELLHTLTTRYAQWLTMAFEDWGYARQGTPRVEDILGAHRLYLAEGFRQQHSVGFLRLAADLKKWRTVLRDARTPAMKILATVMIDDSSQLLARMLSQDLADRALLSQGVELLKPLSPEEYSLQWPLQSQFAFAYERHRAITPTTMMEPVRDWSAAEALAQAAHLRPDTFQKLDHPVNRTVLAASPDHQHTWNTLAAYYEATSAAALSGHSPLPTFREIAAQSSRTFIERITQPIDFEPAWTPISHRLADTDARLRLVSLQLLLHKSPAAMSIPNRLAEIGSQYFDPFTGLPMLWSPTQHKLYSVGHDRLDDGGDPSFDISVPVPRTLTEPSHRS